MNLYKSKVYIFNLRFFALLMLNFLLGLTCIHAQNKIVQRSPDQKLSLELEIKEGKPTCQISYNDKVFMDKSPLGLITSVGDFTQGLKLKSYQVKQIKERYNLSHSKVSSVNYNANELSCWLVNSKNDAIQIIFRITNRDVAFSYHLPKRKNGETDATIESEATGFQLPDGSTTFITPQAPAGSGWENTKPSYEEAYTIEEPINTKSKYGLGYTYPALFHLGNLGWMMISETGVNQNYVGTRLSDSKDGLYKVSFPQSGENKGVGANTVTAKLPFQPSWKTITLGTNLSAIVESTAATDVVKPLSAQTKIFNPGRATWSWIVWQDASCNYDDQVTFIDLAATLNCEYILIDALWDTQIGRDKMAELVKYASKKNVGVLLWYNSNGSWNSAPQTPKNLMNTAEARQNEMAWLQKIGVKGMKVDFFGGDKQVTMKLYHDILMDAAKFGLSVNFHGTTLPRGWERMYPAFATSESVMASENLVFEQSFADRYAQTATIYPFTRNAVASMDFGPVFLNDRLNRDPKKGTIRKTTDAFEIATGVLFFSAIQHWGITPENLKEKPSFLFDFLKVVPTVWDETKLIDGYPGKFCILARRKGVKWYIAAVNGENTAKKVKVTFPMLAGQNAIIISDGIGKDAKLDTKKFDQNTMFEFDLAPNGGTVIYMK